MGKDRAEKYEGTEANDRATGFGAADEEHDVTLLTVQVQICQACLDGRGEMCHTPGCFLIRHDVLAGWDPAEYEIVEKDAEVGLLRNVLQAARHILRSRRPDKQPLDQLAWAVRCLDNFHSPHAAKVKSLIETCEACETGDHYPCEG